MFRSLSNFFYRIASWKILLLALVLDASFPVYFFRIAEERLNAFAGAAIGPIDLLFGYDPARIQRMVAAYGPEGRAYYAQTELTTDVASPIVDTFFFCIVLSLLFRHKPYTLFRTVNMVPVASMGFDFLENTGIVTLLRAYPDALPTVAALTSAIMLLKWVATGVTVGLVLYGLVRWVVGKAIPARPARI